MNTSIEHIPEKKREELKRVVEIIKGESSSKLKVEMIILFGSYSRGDQVIRDFVMDGHNILEYKSDFDILVITRKPSQEKNLSLSYKISKKVNSDKLIDTPISVLVEDIYHINARISESRYFYLEIKRDGILLYDSGKCTLSDGKELTKEQKLEFQEQDFEMWFTGGKNFFEYSILAMNKNNFNDSAFLLHQSAEKYISAFLLVLTGHKPKTHNLLDLYNNILKIDNDFEVWFDLEKELHHFELLRKAYIDARYSKDYTITNDELIYLQDKVDSLGVLVEKKCLAVIN